MSDQQQPAAPPANAIEARAVLDARIADKEFGAKVFAGDAAALRELRDLTGKVAGGGDDVVAAAVTGSVQTALPNSAERIMAGTADLMREIGFTPQAIAATISGQPVTTELFEKAKAFKAGAMKNPDFITRYLGNDPDARRLMFEANAILTLPVKQDEEKKQ